MQIRYELAQDGRRRAVTDGLAPFNQFEIALEMAASVGEDAAANLLRYIGDYLAASGKRLQPGETIRYGWSTLRFAQMPPESYLFVSELADPFSSANDQYVPGAARAITIIAEQDSAVQRNGMVAPSHHPHRTETAVVCSRVAPGRPIRVLVFDRLKAVAPDDSGWFIGCGDKSHNHDDATELYRIFLVRLAELDPRIVYYLALPEGSRIVFERRKVIVFPPGQQEGIYDEGGA